MYCHQTPTEGLNLLYSLEAHTRLVLETDTHHLQTQTFGTVSSLTTPVDLLRLWNRALLPTPVAGKVVIFSVLAVKATRSDIIATVWLCAQWQPIRRWGSFQR